MSDQDEITKLMNEIIGCRDILTAIGDEVRQHIIISMMSAGNCTGMRVNDISSLTNLSRPAVSHHLKILKDTGVLKMRREGTKNYYYFDADMQSFTLLINMLEHAKKIMLSLPDRSGEQ